jgi:AcrR family transcriptional regulator
VTTAPTQRREPTQARSRQTVTRILDAAAAIVDEHGVDAATTRTIADRAGVAYPSLYRFFADRDEILDRLLERHLTDIDARAEAAERTWDISSIWDLVNAELELHIAYYREHPSAARLWMGGRQSTAVVNQVHARMRTLAQRIYDRLVGAHLIGDDVDPRAVVVAVEIADRILELAYRGGHDFDEAILEHGRRALIAYCHELGNARRN